jgi:hypothetical protein
MWGRQASAARSNGDIGMEALSRANRLERSSFQLRFHSLFDAERAYTFPCDHSGHVDMDALGEFDRINYLYARALVGRVVAAPKVQICPAS